MPTDQRYPIEARALPTPRSLRRRLLASLSLTAVLIMTALWAGADPAAAAFGNRAFVPHRGPLQGSRISSRNRTGPIWRRVGSHIYVPPRDGENPPRHPIWSRWPHHPIIGGLPVVSPGPSGIADTPPAPPNAPPSSAGGAATAAINIPPAAERRFVPDQVLVSFAANVPQQAIVNFAQGQRLALLGIHRLPLINTVLYQFRITDQRAVPAVLGGLQGDARVGAAQPNYLYTLQADGQGAATGDPAQYVVAKLHLTEAHAISTGSHALVAVIDSAIDATHPDLRGVVVRQFDTIGGNGPAHEHGTAMASAIAAHGRLVGVAPAAHLLAIRAFDGASADAQSTTTRVLDGLQWVGSSGARVVNMSFTGPPDPRLHDMIAATRQKGLVLVAAAGNDGPQAAPEYPAAYPEVIAVTATDMDDKLLRVANHGRYVAVAAPGVDIFVAAPDAKYGFSTGTSVATAHVSGLAALLIDRNPALTPDQVQAILMRTAKDLGPVGRDDEYGAGLVDAYEALLTQAPATAEQTAAH